MLNPYFNNYNSPYNNFYQPTLSKQEIVKVNGEEGARMYQIAPNSSVLLLDEQKPIVYLKTSDGGGYATITPYSIIAYKPQPPIDINQLDERIKALEEKINESNSSDAKYQKSAINGKRESRTTIQSDATE